MSYWLSHDQCERGELPPVPGDCVQLTDLFFNDGCAPCLESLSVTDGVSTAVARLNDQQGQLSAVSHDFAPGSAVTIELRGCLGTVTFEAIVPVAATTLLIGEPEAQGRDRVAISWTPASMDGDVLADSFGREHPLCHGVDNGRITLPASLSGIQLVNVQVIEPRGRVESDIASLSLWRRVALGTREISGN